VADTHTSASHRVGRRPANRSHWGWSLGMGEPAVRQPWRRARRSIRTERARCVIAWDIL